MAVLNFCAVIWVIAGQGQVVSGYQKQRPLHIGTSRERSVGPLIPWPSNAENNGSFSTISSTHKQFKQKAQLTNEFKKTTTSAYDEWNISKPNTLLISTVPLELPLLNISPFAGLPIDETPSQISTLVKSGPIRPEDQEKFSSTSTKHQLVDILEETNMTMLKRTTNSTNNQIIGSTRPSILPKPSRPSFAGQTGAGTPPQIIQPGKPWPSRPEDYGEFSATSSKPDIVDRFKETTTIRLEGDTDSMLNQSKGSNRPSELPKPSRPSFAGQTGGGIPPQIIQPGKPWPSRPEDYGEFSATSSKPDIVDRFKETTTIRLEGDTDSMLNQSMGSNRPSELPKPSRPSFAGQTGAGTPPQIIQPGKPWPSRPEDYGEFSATSSKPDIVDRFKETTTIRLEGDTDSMLNQSMGSNRPSELPKPSRPSFAGQTGGGIPPQIIQPGKPWPSRPEDYGEFSATSSKPEIVDRFKETTTIRLEGDTDLMLNQSMGSNRPSELPKPSRPSFAGQTGGGIPPQIIQPGKPWPSRPEDYGEFSATSSKPEIVDRFKETTTIRLEGDTDSMLNQSMGSNRPSELPKPSRPSFAGQTGGGIPPQIIQPGKPWPSRPEDYGEFSAMSSKPEIVDRFKETTTIRLEGDTDSMLNQSMGSNRPSELPKPSRPSFAGQTGGGIPPQIIQPGKPWPSRPEDYGEFSATSSKPEIVDRFKETTTIRLEGDTDLMLNQSMGSNRPSKLPKPSRPSFAGQTGGGITPQIIQPGKPWPSRPEDYGEFSATSTKPDIVDRFKEITTIGLEGDSNSKPDQIKGPNRPSQLPKPSRPSFAGQTGGVPPSQIIQPEEPRPTRPVNKEEFDSFHNKPQVVDRFMETTTMRLQEGDTSILENNIKSSVPPRLHIPSRPSFAGLTGGGGIPSQIIPPGEPWPARPEDYLGFNFITYKPLVLDTFKETTTNKLQEGNILIPNRIEEISIPSNLPAPSRPSFAGLTGGRPPSQIIPPGKPWPARPEDYEGFSVTSRMPQLTDRFKGTTKLQKVNISDTILKPVASPERVLPAGSQASTQSNKPWPTKHAEEMMTKIKDEVFFSKKVLNSNPAWPEVNNLLLLDSPVFRQILKSKNPWHVSQNDLISFRPEENPFTSAPPKRSSLRSDFD